MSKVKLISTANHRYNGVWLYGNPPTPFMANNEKDAEELCAIGFAKRVPIEQGGQTYETRVMTAEPSASAVASAGLDEPKTTRPYKRRDLTARQ